MLSKFIGLCAFLVLAVGCQSVAPEVPDAVVSDASNSIVTAPNVFTQVQREAIKSLAGQLSQRPFGTGGSVAIWHDGAVETFHTGTLSEGGPEVKDDTRFNVASISKTLTAARLVSLAHEERVSLGEAVNQALPGVVLHNDKGQNVAGEVTLRQLLRHEAGLSHQPGAALDPQSFNNEWGRPDLLSALAKSWTIPLAYAPGEFHYSNLGYALVGAVIEGTTGMPFAQSMALYMKSLGLTSVTFTPGDIPTGQAASGRTLVQGAVQFHEPGWYGSAYAAPFSGAWLSSKDLATFGHLLGQASDKPGDPLRAMAQASKEPSYDLGIIHQTRHGQRTMEHDGSTSGFLARMVIVPASDVVIVVVTNQGQESKEEAMAFRALTDEMLAVVLAP